MTFDDWNYWQQKRKDFWIVGAYNPKRGLRLKKSISRKKTLVDRIMFRQPMDRFKDAKRELVEYIFNLEGRRNGI